MKSLYFLLAITIVVSFTVDSVLADDCEDLNEQKICRGSNSSTTLSWTNPRITSGEYLIEARDFNWLGSISIRVTKNGAIQEGVLSEGEYYLFDFSNNSTFNGIKIIADQVSNINSFPSNIGTFPSDPQAKISFKPSIPKEKKKPTLEISIIAENETKKSPGITANITIQNSGDSDLIETQVRIIYDGLELNEFDFEENSMNEITASGHEIKWENVSSYKLTPTNPGIIKNGYNIQVLNFSNKTAIINTTYNGSMKSDVLMEGGSIIFGYTRENEYTGIKILGIHISNDAAELTWDEWGEFLLLESNGPRTSVSGPYIVMERSFNKSNISIGETLSVSLSLTNNGDIPTNILVNDSVPQNATFISGTLSFSGGC